ncbi:amidohydrolase [Microbacterium sp. H6]|uniref:amidohydrolase n=1 Tax=Microbacterium TaxID=33882 RepID=UPI00215DAA8F|nr:amidohydrolase [Microbacterium sp. H6]
MRVDLSEFPLVDHHCHGVLESDPSREDFELLTTESDWAAPEGTTGFDSQVGFGIRRYCAPVLDLPSFASPEDYLARRVALGAPEVNRRLLRSTGISDYLIETGYRGDAILTPSAMADAGAARAHEVVRLERIAEQLVEGGCSAPQFRKTFAQTLDDALRAAVGVKSIAAYRIGLDFDPRRPSAEDVDTALDAWMRSTLGGEVRLSDATIIRHLLWEAVDRGALIQFHIGYGDADVDLLRCTPLLLTEFMRLTRASGVRIALLHCYPFHREAGYLAQVFPHVFLDVGLAVNYTGSRSHAVIAESMELAPFSKLMFSSDAFGVAELYLLGALLFRRGTEAALADFAARDGWPVEEQRRVAELISSGNARRVYGIGA